MSTPTAPTKFVPSVHQQAIIEWVTDGSGNLVIQAVAGSGKTRTIIEILRYIPSRIAVLFLAFNTSIAEELGRRVPRNCQAMTLNSMGHRAWGDYCGDAKPTVDGRKTRQIMREVLDYEESRSIGFQVGKLVGLAKSHGIVPVGAVHLKGLFPDAPDTWNQLIERFDIEFDRRTDVTRAIAKARDVLKESIRRSKGLIDYDDQLYMPLICGVPLSQYDWVMVDEAQDLSDVQRALVARAVRPETGRLVCVGDTNQAIYGFRGASSDSIEKIITDFKASVLPLSVTYRCPRSVVEMAQPIVPAIQAAEWAEEGEVLYPKDYKPTDFEPEHMVLCRCVAPLVSFAYKLISSRVPCRVLGRDIGQGLISLIDKLKAERIDGADGLIAKLASWEQKEIARFTSDDREDKIQSVTDKAETLRTIIEAKPEMNTVDDLKGEITALFATDERDARILTLSTIHKAKGLEAPVVWVLEYQMMPLKSAKQDWQKQQELNLIYVAYTRAMKSLRLIQIKHMVDAMGAPMSRALARAHARSEKKSVPATPQEDLFAFKE